MVEHRVDRVAARRAPVAGPLPVAEEIAEIGAPARSPRPVRKGPSRLSRRARRMLRGKRARWALIAFACLAVLLVGLLASGFLSSPARSADAPKAEAVNTSTVPPTSPAPSTSAKKHHGASGTGALVNDPVGLLRTKFNNPLNHLRGAGLHDVVISATSSEPIALVGYLVPTGLGSAYGEVKPHRRAWSVSEQALGRGYLAAIFVQSGRSGAPITCSVRVDGRVTNTETTSGAYGRAVCLG